VKGVLRRSNSLNPRRSILVLPVASRIEGGGVIFFWLLARVNWAFDHDLLNFI
jgi:hypothetical protein